MELLNAIVLGFVQGVTEFLPVASSGPLILLEKWVSVDGVNAIAYDLVLHIATTVAVLTYFRSDVWVLVQALLRKLSRLPVNERELTLAYALLVGTLPAGVIGFIAGTLVGAYPQSTAVAALMLFIASVFFMYVEWRYFVRQTHEGVSVQRGFWIGCFQAIALLPGFSRSGATIAGGMLLGLSRYEAARFSFLLAIPLTLGAAGRKMIDLLRESGSVDWQPIIVGGVVACVTAFIVIHFFLLYFRRYTLWPFIWYSVIISAFVGYVSFIS
ncbi:MAG: hypothetical protein RLZZ480_25 [Candidatus Parcubacteria bacterium]|jgi:undecaprenyl-diphosphatase